MITDKDAIGRGTPRSGLLSNICKCIFQGDIYMFQSQVKKKGKKVFNFTQLRTGVSPFFSLTLHDFFSTMLRDHLTC